MHLTDWISFDALLDLSAYRLRLPSPRPDRFRHAFAMLLFTHPFVDLTEL